MMKDKVCHEQCPFRQYISKVKDENFYQCKDCPDQNCSVCQDSTGLCFKCMTDYQVTESGKCRPICSASEYLNVTTNYCYKCSEKTSNCASCEDNSGECSRCTSKYFLLPERSCKLSCGPSQYIREDPQTGAENCQDCSAIKESGIYCIACEEKTGVCQMCDDEYFLTKKKYCQKKCMKDEYWVGNRTNSCSKCQSNNLNCIKCLNETGACQECKDGYAINQNGACQKGCKPGREYWVEKDQECKKCMNNCQECESNTGVCLKCNEGFTYSVRVVGCVKRKKEEESDDEEGDKDPNDPIEATKSAKLLTQYFDPLTESVVLVYDRVLTEDSKVTDEENNLELYLVNEFTEVIMEVTKEAVDEIEPFKKRLYFLFPTEEVNRGKIGLKKKPPKKGNRILEEESRGQNQTVKETNSTSEWFTLIENVNYFRSSNIPTIKILGTIFSFAIMVVGFILVVISISNFFILFNTIQLIHLLSLFDANLPSNVLAFSKMFKKNLLSPISIEIVGVGGTRCKMPASLYRAGISCAALDGPLTPFLGYLIVILVLRSIGQILVNSVSSEVLQGGKVTVNQIKRKEKSKLTHEEKKFLRYLKFRKMLPQRFILYFLMSAQLDVFTSCLVSLRYGGYGNWKMILNNTLSALVIIMYLVVIGYLLKNGVLKKKKAEKEKKPEESRTRRSSVGSTMSKSKVQTILDEAYDAQLIGVEISTASNLMILNVILSCLVVFGLIFPPIQLIVGTLVLAIVAVYIFVTITYRKGWISQVQMFKYLFLAMVYLCLGLTAPGLGLSIGEETRYNGIGFLINCTLCCFLVFLMVATTILSFSTMKKKLRNQRGKRNHEFEIPNEACNQQGDDGGLQRRMRRISYRSTLKASVTHKIESMNNLKPNGKQLLQPRSTSQVPKRVEYASRHTNPLRNRLENHLEEAQSGQRKEGRYSEVNNKLDSIFDNDFQAVRYIDPELKSRLLCHQLTYDLI